MRLFEQLLAGLHYSTKSAASQTLSSSFLLRIGVASGTAEAVDGDIVWAWHQCNEYQTIRQKYLFVKLEYNGKEASIAGSKAA